jgi:hypothetical protein
LFKGTGSRDTNERFETTPSQSGFGGNHSRLVSPEDAIALRGAAVASTPMKAARRDGTTPGSTHTASPAPPHPTPSTPLTTGLCMWHVAGNLGMASKAGDPHSCKLGTACARDHTSKTPAQWVALLTKGDIREWRVSSRTKEEFGNALPGFDKTWL